MKRALVLAITLCLGATSSLAKPSTTVFPLTAPNLPMKIASAPEELSKALADELGGDVAKVPIDDAAGLAGCDPEATTCLETVSRNFKSKRIVFGSIEMVDEERLKVTLTRFDPGPDRQQRTFTVEGSVEEMAEELVDLSRPLFDGSKEDEDPEETTENPLPDPKPVVTGATSGTTMVVLVGGGAVTAVGVGFLISSQMIARDVSNSKPRTEADFKRLVPLEEKGAQRQLIGAVLTGVGAVALTYGLLRYMTDRSSGTSEDSLSRRLTPVPVEGGAAVVYSMEWR
ncbi:MAG: hypothetical protein ACKV2T_23365 [Kofleriaceae bacterium]